MKTEAELSERFHRDSHPNHWFNYAQDFREAAIRSIGLSNVFNYLCGTAIELLLKSYLALKDDNSDGVKKFSHNIPDLYKATDLTCLDKNERKVLDGYKVYVEFRGKYPTAKNKEKHNDFYKYYEDKRSYINSKSKIFTTDLKTTPTSENFDNIWKKIEIEYIRLYEQKHHGKRCTFDIGI